MCFSQEKSEKATDPVADRAEAVQVEATVVLAADPGPGVVQEVPWFPGAGRARPHRVLQAVQARPAAQLRHVRAQQLLSQAVARPTATRSRLLAVPRTPGTADAVPRAPGTATVPLRVAGRPTAVRATVQQRRTGQEPAGKQHGPGNAVPAVFGVGVLQG